MWREELHLRDRRGRFSRSNRLSDIMGQTRGRSGYTITVYVKQLDGTYTRLSARSRHPFEVVEELPMPKRMGKPKDWR